MPWTSGAEAFFPSNRKQPWMGHWEEASVWPKGVDCYPVLGQKVRLQEVRRRQKGGGEGDDGWSAGQGSTGGQAALDALPGQDQRQQGLRPQREWPGAQGAKLSMSHRQKMSLEKSVHRKTVGSATQGHVKFRGPGAVLTLCWLSLEPPAHCFQLLLCWVKL